MSTSTQKKSECLCMIKYAHIIMWNETEAADDGLHYDTQQEVSCLWYERDNGDLHTQAHSEDSNHEYVETCPANAKH